MTATPDGEDHSQDTGETAADEVAEATREPDLNAVGDNHMPDDLREAERESGEESRDRAAQARGDRTGD